MFRKRGYLVKVLLGLGLLVALAGCGGGPPHCSADWLIMAINNANSNGPGLDTIDLDPGCTYQLAVVDNTVDGNNGLPSITTSIVINGHGATVRRSTSSQKAAIRLFHVAQNGELVLNDITLYDGMGMEPVDVTDVVRNSGGAVFNAGILTVNNSTLDYNRARRKGGGIYNLGTMTITNSTLKNNGVNIGNEPDENGGAIWNGGTATITGTTIVGNIASQSGGGIANSYGGAMTVTNSTISANSTTLAGIVSGAAVVNGGSLTLEYTTITSNSGTTSGAVFSAPDTIEISNSIIAVNLPSNCSYPATSPVTGANLDNDGSCDGFTITADPLLGPLADNGGPTHTHAIPDTSPAKNAAVGACPAVDQRGEPRPYEGICDLGAFELNASGGFQQDPSYLEGVVFDDLNADGVMDPGEPPLAGVKLVFNNGTCPVPGVSMTTYSASDGSFQFILMAPTAGTHCIQIDPLDPPNDSILIPGGFTTPANGEFEITLLEGEDVSDILFGWDYQFSGTDIPPNPVITNVDLSTTTPADGDFVEVEVTIENMGAYPAEDYELVLIPHYGWGPPNPAGYVTLPDLMPGVPHVETFTPGVLYSPAGTYTLRVLVTDDWYALADPDSTGTNGDYQDFTITVSDVANNCQPFYQMDPNLVLLSIREDIMSLPIYLETEDIPIPWSGPGPDPSPEEYRATLGEVPSNTCGLQGGFTDRLYCTFTLTEEMPGKAYLYKLYRQGCDEAVHEVKLLLPEMKPDEDDSSMTCREDLGAEDCKMAGGKMVEDDSGKSYCSCP